MGVAKYLFTLPFIPSHQGRGMIGMPLIPDLKSEVFLFIVLNICNNIRLYNIINVIYNI